MCMMTSQIFKFFDFTKTQKTRYLENETLFFLKIKKSLITHQGLLYDKNNLKAEVTSNVNLFKQKNINQMFDKIQMILMMKKSISNNRISRLKNTLKSTILVTIVNSNSLYNPDTWTALRYWF